MRIAIHCSYFGEPWNEGVKNMVSLLAQRLRREGHDVFILARSVTGKATGTMEVGTGPFLAYAHAGSIAAAHGADIVHTIQSINPLTGVRTRLIKSFSRLPVVLHVTGIGMAETGFGIGHNADANIVGSPCLTTFYPGADVIPAIPYLHDLTPLPAPSLTDIPVVGFLGAFEPGRGVEPLLHASRILLDRGVQHRLELAWNGVGGTEGYNRVQALARQLELPVNIQHTVDIRSFYAAARTIVIPRETRRRMALPLRVIECALLQRPVAVSRILGMDKIVGDMGVSFEAGSANSMADALQQLLSDNQLYSQCLTAMQNRRNEFLPEQNYARIIDIYRRISS